MVTFLALIGLIQDADSKIPDIVDRVMPAVVSVFADRQAPEGVRNLRFPKMPELQEPQKSLGSGVIVRPDGIILTNNHVVDQAREIRVVLSDRREFKAKVVGADKRTDVAVLRIEAKDLPALPFGDSARIRVGETVLAVGNPMGVGLTVSKGIISAKGRANVGVADNEDFLQTDAAINPGNSGGALVNTKGELIGINTAIASRSGGFEGIGFAIPSNMAREVMEIILKDGKLSRGQMGIMVQDMTPQLAKAMGGAPEKGVLVADVMPGTPAEKAGLKKGDVVLKLNGEPVETAAQLRNRVALRGAGAQIKLDVWREGETREFSMRLRREEETVRQGREDNEGIPDEAAGAESGLEGILVSPATPAMLRRYGLPHNAEGPIVTSVDPARAGGLNALKEGDLVIEVNRKPVKTAAEMRQAARETGNSLLLQVRRGEATVFIAVTKQ